MRVTATSDQFGPCLLIDSLDPTVPAFRAAMPSLAFAERLAAIHEKVRVRALVDLDPKREPSGVVWYFCSAECRFGASVPFSPGHAHDYKDLPPSVVPGDAKCARCEKSIDA